MHPICAADMLDNILKGTKCFAATGTAATGATAAPTLTFDAEGFIPVLYCNNIVATDVAITVDRAVWIIDVWAVKTGAAGSAGGQVIVNSGSDAVTNAISLNVANGVVARATSISPQYMDVASTINLDVTATGDVNCLVFVLCLRVGNIS